VSNRFQSPGYGIPLERIPCFPLGRRLVGSKSQSGEEKSEGVELIMAVDMQITAFRGVMPCSLVNRY
jgi:hypothetical protein